MAYDQVGDRLPITYENLGEQHVKNISRAIRVYKVWLTGQTSEPTKIATEQASPPVSVRKQRRSNLRLRRWADAEG